MEKKFSLHQLIALIPKVKSRDQATTTKHHQLHQKRPLFEGQERTYQPLDDEGDRFPSENKRVERRVREALDEVRTSKSDLFNLVRAQDAANTQAKADVSVDGEVLLREVPVTHLLFLEKQMVDLGTFVSHLPTLTSDVDWTEDENTDQFRSQPIETIKTQKVDEPIVLYEATDRHPAQTQLVTRDKPIGRWQTTRFSGALPAAKKREIMERVQQLHNAVVEARERANSFQAEKEIEEGKAVFDFLFGNG